MGTLAKLFWSFKRGFGNNTKDRFTADAIVQICQLGLFVILQRQTTAVQAL